MSGIELLSRVRAEKIPCGVIVLTGHGDPQLALECMKAGADDFVAKPCDPARLILLVQRTLEQRRLIDELEQLRNQLREDYWFHNIVSKSPKMRTDLRPDQAGWPAGLDGPDLGRNRDRQGTDRPGDPRLRTPAGKAHSSP